ncbi:MAG TPA: glycosyltransferase [Bryobacteraceae bacterium]|nr:glycosyltransferase [Bryobacteraceae bacterium]
MIAELEQTALTLDQYVPQLGAAEVDELRTLARPLEGATVGMVNSTAVGGGVAEILMRLLPLMRELGLEARWHVMEGETEFFEVTKAFHNSLQGGTYTLGERGFEIYRDYNRRNLESIPMDSRFIVIHDPQPAAFIDARRQGADQHWIWRCHIDLSRPDPNVWNFLEPYVNRYEGSIFSSPEYSRQLQIPQYLFYPSIDPLADKNRELEPGYVESVLEKYGIDGKRRILTQISRFDRWKDPIGVVKTYRIVRRYFDCQLVLAGGGASDDPEGAEVLKEVREAAGKDRDIFVLELPAFVPLEINALQRASTIVIQKSLREGFGLTVAEALWKKKPVVASAVGGIPLQVIHKHTGMLAHSVEGTAYQIRFLLSHPEIAKKLGEQGHEHVRENFLITGNLRRYLTLFLLCAGTGVNPI